MVVCGCLWLAWEGEGQVGGGVAAVAVTGAVVGDLVGTALVEIHPAAWKQTHKVSLL